MLKLIPRYKQGNKSPDHDPDNPYHYHTGGKKIVITPEDWEANVGKPYFKEVENAVSGQLDKKPENSSFVSELDWSPESWFSKRVAKPDGTYYNANEAARLASHVPEYHNIEQTSKQNGTWLKMDDGSTWEGDPRAWVMMQSQAYRRNYSPKPWYTGQAEWPTQFDYPGDKKGAIKTNKVTRAPYYNGQMWFSNDKTYGDAFSYYYASTGEGMRQSIPEEANVSGHTFLSAIPKKGIYRKLAAPKPGTADMWDSMPYFLRNGHIYREKPSNISITQDFKHVHNTRKDGKKVLTDDVVNWSRDLGDQGIFLHQVDDGRGIKFSGDVIDILKRYSEGRNAKKKVKKSEFRFTYPILEEFISQPGFTDKVKFIEGNTGDFDINNPYKYAENVLDNDSSQDTVHYAALGGHLYVDGGPIKIGYAAGGKLKLIPRALEGIQFPVILQPAVADNTRYVRPYTSIEIAKSKKAYEQEQLQKLIEAAQERLPLLKADTRSTEQRQRDHNRAIQLEVKQKANELAANFGRALGANHDMTVDEVNQNTLNTANLMGYMVAPYLMTTLESGYYLGTGRPKEAAITAGIGYGLPALNKPLANVSNTTKAIAVSNRLKKGIKNTTLPAQEPLIDVNPIYNFIDNGTPFNGKLPLIGYVNGNLELFPNRPLILRPEKSYHTIDRAYLESSLPDFVKDSGLRNMLKQTYESISESTPSSPSTLLLKKAFQVEPKIPNDKFIVGGVDKVKWINDKPIFIAKTPEEIYHPKFVRDAYKKPNEQVVDETYDIFRQKILDKFGIKLKENYDAKDIEDAFYSLETPTTDDFSKVMHNERWYNPDFNDDQKLFAEYFNQYWGLKNKNFVSYIDLKNAVKEGLQFGIDYLKSPGFAERSANMHNKYNFSYSPSDFALESRRVTWMPEYMNAHSGLLFGLSSRRRLPFRLGGTATHEVFHWNPKFNTRINSSKGITLTKPADSPYYSNNYSDIPEDVKAILRPNKEKLIARELKGLGDLQHDAEISESYSDLQALRYNLMKEGIFDSRIPGLKFDQRMLDAFRKTKRGKTDRFIDLHNDDQTIKAVNEIAQNGNEEISYV